MVYAGRAGAPATRARSRSHPHAGRRGDPVDTIERALVRAQGNAANLFAEVITHGLIRAGITESQLTEDIYALAANRFGVRRHWHKRVVRCGPNAALPYQANPPDRRIEDDDIVYLDFGPVFGEWEADFGRTYVLGTDALKHRLVSDIEAAFRRGKDLYRLEPNLTAGELYDHVCDLANESRWEFGAPTAGHLIGHFPHERSVADPARFSIRHGNLQALREPDEYGRTRHWILEIHFVNRDRSFGGFFEDLLTIDTVAATADTPATRSATGKVR